MEKNTTLLLQIHATPIIVIKYDERGDGCVIFSRQTDDRDFAFNFLFDALSYS